jgi:hypothetical protein
MVQRFLLAFAVLAAGFAFISRAAAQESKPPERIAITNLKKKIDSGDKFLLIDVREDWELEQNGAIQGAVHIPMAELDARMKDIPKDVEIVFY